MNGLHRMLAVGAAVAVALPANALAQPQAMEVVGDERIPGKPSGSLERMLKELKLKGLRENPDFGITFGEALRQRLVWIQRTAPPTDSSDDLASLISVSTKDCAVGRSGACSTRDLLLAAKAELGRAPVDCNGAARRFSDAGYADVLDDSAPAQAYDAACLGSMIPRVIGGAIEAPVSKPSLIADPAQEGELLSAVAIFENGHNNFFCAGLFLPAGKVLTARHCFGSALLGNTQVRSAQSGKRWPIENQMLPADEGKVASDWVVVSLTGADFPTPPKFNLTRLGTSPTAFVIGPFHSAKMMKYDPAPTPDGDFLRYSLRYPKPGTCVALAVRTGCLALTCQTVTGFSGAPVFSARQSDGSYDVIGIVSGGDGNNTGCVAESDLRFATFAVSADNIKVQK